MACDRVVCLDACISWLLPIQDDRYKLVMAESLAKKKEGSLINGVI